MIPIQEFDKIIPVNHPIVNKNTHRVTFYNNRSIDIL